MSAHIDVTRHGTVQVLTIRRPEKRNALTQDMYRALTDGLMAGDEAPDVGAHVILGQPGIFSSGNDINDFLAAAKGARALPEDVVRFVEYLPQVAKPLVAGVDGAAVGVGATFLLHCDLVYATPAASLSTPFLDLGLVPEAASSLLLPRRTGHQRAFEMLVLGDPFDAERAREAGLVNAVVEPEVLETRTIGAAERLASKPPHALAIARRLLRGDPEPVLTRMREEADYFRACLGSAEAREAFEAFLDKRRPDFDKLRGS